MPLVCLLASAVGLPGASPLHAQVPDTVRPRTPDAAGPRLAAARRRGPIIIDGRLDEEAWGRAPVGRDFVQGDPVEGAEPARPTEVRVLFDAHALYVGARLYDRGPAAIADQLVRRDEEGQYDYFQALFDPNLDRQTGYLFRVSASGVERDAYLHGDTQEDVEWDAVWESGVRVDSAGWGVEMRIPLSQIRFESHDTTQVWGVNFARRRLRSNSTSYFALESRTVEGRVSQFGRLTGILLPESERRFEVEPYVATELSAAPAESGNPFEDGTELAPRAGVNVRYGIGSAFSLDAAVNPDFGQVEVDPAVVNLTAFETFFPEKRPFFVQDARIFDFDLSSRDARLFFSRRIGREPHSDGPAGAEFIDVPERTTILGASKFTGRTRGGLSVGALAAMTQEETGRAFDRETGRTTRFVAEPRSGYGVARVQQDFRDGATRVGAILTAVTRDLPDDGPLRPLPSAAYSGGVDFAHQWGGPQSRRWSLSGYVAGSHVRGSRDAMVDIQTNPQHYQQRPDADDLSVDSTATHLTGVNWNVRFARQSGQHWTWSFAVEQLSPDFALNDLGFLDQGEQFDFEADVAYRDIDPGPLFRNWRVSFFTFHELRHELLDDPGSTDRWAQAYKNGQLNLNGQFEFLNNWLLETGVEYGPASLSDTETRGGPLMADPAGASASVGLATDPREIVSVGPAVELTDTFSGGGHRTEIGLDVTVRPAPSFELRLLPSVSFEDDAAQFVASTDAVPFEPTYGTRYLFADLERTEVSVETRLSVTLSPDLSLQVFLQPLLSSADFVTFKQLARPESFDFDRFRGGVAEREASGVVCRGGRTCVADGRRHFDFDADGRSDFDVAEQDFNVRSLRGNAVLRWEYLSGSTLFLVWQQDRRNEADVGDFRLGRDLDGLFGAASRNTFIVKVSHFLDL